MSRKKAAYLGLLGLGVVAFVADRAFFAPSGAEASTTDAALAEPQPAITPRPDAVEPVAPPGKPLSARLAQASHGLWDDADVPDAFHSRASWIAEAMMGPPVPDTPESKSENAPHEHKLSSTYKVEGRYHAIIDLKPYAVGDTLEDGLVITSIDKNGVELSGSAGTVNLALRSHP